MSLRIFGSAVSILFTIYFSQNYSANIGASVLYFYAIITFCLNFSCFGFDQASFSYVEKVENSSVSYSDIFLSFTFTAVFFLVMVFLILELALSDDISSRWSFLMAVIFFLSAARLSGFFFQQKKWYLISTICITAGFPIAFSFFFYFDNSIERASISAALILSLFSFFYLRVIGLKFSYLFRGVNLPLLLLSLPIFLSSLLSSCITWMPFLISRLKISDENIAFYSYCMRLSNLVSFVLIASGFFFLPKIALAFSKGSLRERVQIMQASSFLVCIISVILLFTIYLFDGYLISFITHDVNNALRLFYILIAGQLLAAMLGFVGYALIASNNQLLLLRNAFLGLLISIIFTYSAYNESSLTMFALSTMSGVVAYNVFCWVTVFRVLNIKVYPSWSAFRREMGLY